MSHQPEASNPIRITVTDGANGRRLASSGSKWEPVMGYSRAVRVGNIIAVTGTIGVNAGEDAFSNIQGTEQRLLFFLKGRVSLPSPCPP